VETIYVYGEGERERERERERESLLERNHGWFTLRYAVCIPSNDLTGM
jgi:hypothetical protein